MPAADATEASGIHWFRRDLRVADNPAWNELTRRCERVCALFVLDPRVLDGVGAPRRRYLVQTLRALDATLRQRGGALRIEHGDPAEVIPQVAAAIGASMLSFNHDVTGWARQRDDAVIAAASLAGMEILTADGCYVHEPGRVLGANGAVPKVFAAFHRRWLSTPWTTWPEPDDTAVLADPADGPEALADVVPPEATTADEPAIGEAAVLAWCEDWLATTGDRYSTIHDDVAADATSHLSPALHLGVISARRVVEAARSMTLESEPFVRQLAWREWFAHLLAANPNLVDHAMDTRYDRIEWRSGAEADADFERWRTGQTGYPIVDAGMRELAATGRLHNRLRMVVASFLVKDLLIDWRRGERYFRAQLLDGDVAQNVGNWQWVAGAGADAAPYFRIFNPVTQSRTRDASGEYVRKWVPELSGLDRRAIHAPWESGPLVTESAGVALGTDYPWPIVDHAEARVRTMAAYRAALG